MNIAKITTASLLIASVSLSACHTGRTAYLRKFRREAKKEVKLAHIHWKKDSLRIRYPELTMFDFGKADIKPDASNSVQHLATLLTKYNRINFVINGYTDNVGTNDVNQSLSQRRADNAKNLCVTDGVSSGRIQTNGLGSSNPIRSNNSDNGRAANRRVEFLLYDKK